MTMLTTEQAADRLGVTPARVRVLIREGRLPAQSFGRAHMINEDDLKFVENRKPGRPPKVKSDTSKTSKKGGRK
jgi:excisionase family DNA binding protein